MTKVTLRPDGDAIGVTFPAEMSTRLGFEAGQHLTVIELEDGVKLVKHAPRLERQLDIAREILREQAPVLQDLAKR